MARFDEFFVHVGGGWGGAPRYDVFQWLAAAGKLENTMNQLTVTSHRPTNKQTQLDTSYKEVLSDTSASCVDTGNRCSIAAA